MKGNYILKFEIQVTDSKLKASVVATAKYKEMLFNATVLTFLVYKATKAIDYSHCKLYNFFKRK